jgi:ribosomal protein L21
MYAVIESGGKQYIVQPGDVVQIEKIEGEVGAARFERRSKESKACFLLHSIEA